MRTPGGEITAGRLRWFGLVAAAAPAAVAGSAGAIAAAPPLLEAGGAVHGLVAAGLEWHLSLLAAARARCTEHLARAARTAARRISAAATTVRGAVAVV